jgi:hypothetical protein
MRIKPVRRMAAPSYPTWDCLRDHPELLELVPERWRHNGLVLAVLGGVMSLIMASQSQAADQRAASGDASRLAPIFAHGGGRGTFGCMTVNPPVFLSEAEARQVVQDEAKKAGLEFAPDALTLHDAMIPVMPQANGCDSVNGSYNRGLWTKTGDLVLDGYDQKHNVAFEFVSQSDYSSWEKKDTGCSSSVASYNLKGTAEVLRSGLATRRREVWIGIFYEPGTYPTVQQAIRSAATGKNLSPYAVESKDATHQRGEEELRKQVQNFIQWLKAQGVI